MAGGGEEEVRNPVLGSVYGTAPKVPEPSHPSGFPRARLDIPADFPKKMDEFATSGCCTRYLFSVSAFGPRTEFNTSGCYGTKRQRFTSWNRVAGVKVAKNARTYEVIFVGIAFATVIAALVRNGSTATGQDDDGSAEAIAAVVFLLLVLAAFAAWIMIRFSYVNFYTRGGVGFWAALAASDVIKARGRIWDLWARGTGVAKRGVPVDEEELRIDYDRSDFAITGAPRTIPSPSPSAPPVDDIPPPSIERRNTEMKTEAEVDAEEKSSASASFTSHLNPFGIRMGKDTLSIFGSSLVYIKRARGFCNLPFASSRYFDLRRSTDITHVVVENSPAAAEWGLVVSLVDTLITFIIGVAGVGIIEAKLIGYAFDFVSYLLTSLIAPAMVVGIHSRSTTPIYAFVKESDAKTAALAVISSAVGYSVEEEPVIAEFQGRPLSGPIEDESSSAGFCAPIVTISIHPSFILGNVRPRFNCCGCFPGCRAERTVAVVAEYVGPVNTAQTGICGCKTYSEILVSTPTATVPFGIEDALALRGLGLPTQDALAETFQNALYVASLARRERASNLERKRGPWRRVVPADGYHVTYQNDHSQETLLALPPYATLES